MTVYCNAILCKFNSGNKEYAKRGIEAMGVYECMRDSLLILDKEFELDDFMVCKCYQKGKSYGEKVF